MGSMTDGGYPGRIFVVGRKVVDGSPKDKFNDAEVEKVEE